MHVLLLFALGGAAITLLLHKSTPATVSTGRSAGAEAGRLYRVQVGVPLQYVTDMRAQHDQKTMLADLERRVERVGFERTLLSMQDPTSRRDPLFTIISHRSNTPIQADPLLRFLKVEAVEEPPHIDKLYVPSAESLDSGLSPEEVMTIRQALLEDMNPRHLNGIAYCLEPFFPVSASLLRTKADILDLRKLPAAKSDKTQDAKLTQSLKNVWERSVGLTDSSLDGLTKSHMLRARQDLQTFAQKERLPLSVIKDEVRRVACFMVEKDADTDLSRFPAELVDAAKLLLVEVLNEPQKLQVVCPKRLKILVPPNEEDGFISPSAIQLALATSKPEAAGVFKSPMAPRLYDSLLAADRKDPDNLRAKAQMERANRAIERRRWVDWFRRKTNARAGRVYAS